MITSLITGGTGFIGSHLVELLHDNGHNVVIASRKKHIDITDFPALENLFEKHHFDYIFHLAAEGTLYNHTGGTNLLHTNIVGSYHLFQLAKKYHTKGIINTGSSSEYGACAVPVKEDLAPRPTFTFAATKAAITMIASAFASEFDLPIVTVRPFAVYGPGDHRHRFIPKVIQAAFSHEVLSLHPGVHDWIYVKDVASAMVMLVMKAPILKGRVFNIGSGMQTDNATVVHLIEQITGRSVPLDIKSSELRSYDKNIWIANTESLREVICWEPTTLIEGLQETVRCSRDAKK